MTILQTINSDIKNWWLFIIKGLVFLAAGIYVFCSPLAGYATLSIFFSIVILVSGFSQVFFASANAQVLKGWGWTLVSGILDIVIGFYLISYPLITMATLPFILGFWLVFRSFYLMGISFELKSYKIESWGWLLTRSTLLLITALFIIYYPAAGVISIVAFTGTAFIIGGVLNFLLAFKFKKLHKTFSAFSK